MNPPTPVSSPLGFWSALGILLTFASGCVSPSVTVQPNPAATTSPTSSPTASTVASPTSPPSAVASLVATSLPTSPSSSPVAPSLPAPLASPNKPVNVLSQSDCINVQSNQYIYGTYKIGWTFQGFFYESLLQMEGNIKLMATRYFNPNTNRPDCCKL